ncbi:MAG: class I SAM-dependent methyltransferase [Chloroflexi bacterium]|nr:class I SAM-dependent methyltransferase [Chloroflexota bacterium]
MLSGFLQEQRFQAVIPYLNGSILDLGCGLANLTYYLKPGQYYVGIERPEPFLTWLQQHRPNYRFHQRDLDQDLLALDEQFDTITMIAVIEHLKQPAFILRQIPSVMRPEAHLVITTTSPIGDWIHRFGAQLGLFSKQAVKEHHTIFSPTSMHTALIQNGLKLVTYKRFLMGGNQLFIAKAVTR